jgi:hypothetical protein
MESVAELDAEYRRGRLEKVAKAKQEKHFIF